MIKLESILGNKKIVVGESGYDLVLQSLGKIYIKQGNSLKNLEDLFKNIESTGLNEQTLYFIDSLDELQNVPDYKLVYTNKSLYIKIDGKLEKLIGDTIPLDYVKKSGDTMTGTLEIFTDDVPLKIKSSKLIKNLNSDYLRGYTPDDFAHKVKDENIIGSWSFSNIISFFRDVLFKGSLVSSKGFASGFGGYGWKLDSETNTLTIDNLVVRKIMAVYELVVNKISATNGSLWISSGAKVTEVYELEVPEFDSSWGEYITDEFPSINIINSDGVQVNRHLYKHYFNGICYKIKLDDTNIVHSPFRLFDILRCQRFVSTSVKYYDGIVTKIDNNFIYLQLSNVNNNIYSVDNTTTDNRQTVTVELDSPEKGDSLVRIGNIYYKERQGSIYMSSEEENGPFIDILQDVNRPDFSVLLQDSLDNKFKKCLKVRLGNLNGIYDPAFGELQPHGYGLYGENIFLKGVFVQVLPDGSEKPISVWRGEWLFTNTYYYYNQVSYSGQIYTCIKENGSLNSQVTPDLDNSNWELSIMKGLDGTNGTDGNNAPEVMIRYSENIDGPWVSEFYTGCLYAQMSVNGGLSWNKSYKIVGEDGQQGAYLNFKFKLDLINSTFPNWDGSSLDSTWKDSPETLVEGKANWMTTRYYIGQNPLENSLWSTPVRITGSDGSNGNDGKDGPSLLYFGEYSNSEIYTVYNNYRIVVKKTSGLNSIYYVTKTSYENGITEGTTFSGKDPAEVNSNYWKLFDGNFKSIATEVLFAEYANIGGLIFKNEQLISQSGKVDGVSSTDIKNPNFIPNLTIDGKIGLVDMIIGSFGKQLDGSGFFVEGNSIIGKRIFNDILVDRIHITTDILPPLDSLMADELGSSYILDENGEKLYKEVPLQGTDVYYTPNGDPGKINGVIYECSDAASGRVPAINYSGTLYSSQFEIVANGDLLKRILTFKVFGTKSTTVKGGRGGNEVVGSSSGIIHLQKYNSGSWSDVKSFDDGTHRIVVSVGDILRFKLTSNQECRSNIFGLVPNQENSLITSTNGIDYPGWPDNVINGVFESFIPLTIQGQLQFPLLNVSDIKVFNGVAKTIIACDGFCSYWGPENYFYFQKDTGLKTSSGSLNQNIVILTEEQALNSPRGTLYYSSDGIVKYKL